MAGFQWSLYEADLDQVTGSEQRGTRPVLVVSNEEFNQAIANVTILPLTSTSRRLYPSEVFLPAGTAGQPRDSIIMAHQIRTIAKQRLGNHIGEVTNAAIRFKIKESMREHLDL